ncbi:hypothetical protein [Paenibacillus pini]|uniref:hypothetical protein n=1 Tax=Paenibacillus pini TaxID=669461 RepID=UPI00056D2C46|nr:hypothetical protein [Paenibacillus pini]
MSESPIDYNRLNDNLKKKADFYTRKIWGISYTGEVEFSKGQRREAEIVFWGSVPSIRFKRELADPKLEFCLDDLLVRMLTRWYCYKKGLNKETDFLRELEAHGICSTNKFLIHNKKAYTGSIDKRLWNPTIRIIELNIEFGS